MRSTIIAALMAVLAASGCLATAPAAAHSGGLDKRGCHTNRSTGDYHCHGGAPAAAPRAPAPRRDQQGPAPAGLAPARMAPARPAAGTGVFANCTEARAAGAAPVRRGDPGFGPHLDRDGDGVGCEPYRGR